MSFDELGNWMRDLVKRVDDLERRASSTVMTGQVKSVEGDKAVVEFDAKDAVTGKPFASPSLRWSNFSGGSGGGLAEYNPLTVGETVAVLSPSGELGPHSRIIPWGPTDDNAAPASQPADGKVIKFGQAVLTVKPDGISAKVGDVGFSLTSTGFTHTGGTLKHDAKNIGKDHKHSGVQPGGSITDVPV